MEWNAPAIVLDARAYGEGGAIATVLTEGQGLYRGLVHGGGARGHTALWQKGNLVQARWVARLSEQLGSLSAELVHPGAALAMDDAIALSILSASCAVAEGALPEREPHPGIAAQLVRLIAGLPHGTAILPELVRWELRLLADLGYGLDLSCCAVTGATTGLAFVSPRTGRAVAEAAAGVWKNRLLRLPPFLLGPEEPERPATSQDWRDGLKLTGHFLTRDVFGVRHQPLPLARRMLFDRVAAIVPQEPPDA